MRLLFSCTHNACRSILGEVINRELAGGRLAQPFERMEKAELGVLLQSVQKYS